MLDCEINILALPNKKKEENCSDYIEVDL